MKKSCLFYAVILLALYSCDSKSLKDKTQQRQDVNLYSQDSASVSNSSPEPILAPAKPYVSFTPPEIVKDEEFDIESKSNEGFLGDKSNIRNKKNIKNGNITIETNNLLISKKKLDIILHKYNAYYETESLDNNDQTITYNFKIRIPVENFDKLISSLEIGNDQIKSKSIDVQEVTEEFVDIETRLSNKRAYLKRYRELLSKANNVKDVISIEDNIRILQEEIESKEGRLNYLNDQISLSTLELELYKVKDFIYKPQHQDSFLEKLKKSLGQGWIATVNTFFSIVAKWPFIVILFSCLFLLKNILKRRNSRFSK